MVALRWDNGNDVLLLALWFFRSRLHETELVPCSKLVHNSSQRVGTEPGSRTVLIG